MLSEDKSTSGLDGRRVEFGCQPKFQS